MAVVLFSLLSGNTEAQQKYDNFYKAMREKDSTALERILYEIRSGNDHSAERYIAEYNYWVNRAHISEGPVLSTELPEGEGISGIYTLTDSNGNVSGYMYGLDYYDPQLTDTAIAVISEGIMRYPDRLDMRFGKIHLLGESGRWQPYTEEILSTLDRNKANEKAWVYPDVTESMDTVLIYSVLDYEKKILNSISDFKTPTAQDSLMFLCIRRIAQGMLQQYPKDVFSLNMMAATYHCMNQADSALIWLLKAEKANPKDALVLLNIADAYYRMGDRKKDKAYLKKAKKYGNEEIKEAVRYRLQNN